MISAASAPDPMVFADLLTTSKHYVGYDNTDGISPLPWAIDPEENTQTIIMPGQSNHASSGGTTAYTTSSAKAQQLNIYDGAIYPGTEPVFGCTDARVSEGGASSVCMRLADSIISRGKADRVIVVPIAIGGTSFEDWLPGSETSLFTRVRAAILRVRAIGLEPDQILWGMGEQDCYIGTSQANVTARVRAIAQGVRDLGCDAPFWAGLFATLGGTVYPAVRNGLIGAVDATLDIRQGFDLDSLTVAGGYRQGGTHLSDSGLNALATGWSNLVYPD